jgi:hypothetical protein
MQHYGIPTRLIDWTDVLGVAIAFALYNESQDTGDSSVFVLSPLALNKMSAINEIKRAANASNFSYKTIFWHNDPYPPIYPIAIDSTFQNARIAAQNGTFTVHGHDAKPLEVQASDAIRKINIRSAAKPGAREFLEYANLNAFSIYPDIVGMAAYILRKHLKRPY